MKPDKRTIQIQIECSVFPSREVKSFYVSKEVSDAVDKTANALSKSRGDVLEYILRSFYRLPMENLKIKNLKILK